MTYLEASTYERKHLKHFDINANDIIDFIILFVCVLFWSLMIFTDLLNSKYVGQITQYKENYTIIDPKTKDQSNYRYYIKYIDKNNQEQLYVSNIGLKLGTTKIERSNKKYLYLRPLISIAPIIAIMVFLTIIIIIALATSYWDEHITLTKCIYKTIFTNIKFKHIYFFG